MKGWRSRAGLCLMRLPAANQPATPCVQCLHDRLLEAGFSPRGPVDVEASDDWTARFDAAAAAMSPHPLATVVLRLVDDRLVAHRLLARPACPVCGPGQRAHCVGATNLPAEALFDPLLGIASCLQATDPVDADASALCHALSGQVHTPGNRHAVSARGQGLSAERARLGHLGESAERYAAFRPDPDRLLVGTARDLPCPALLGNELIGTDAAQQRAAGHVKLDGRRRIAWTTGVRLSDGSGCAVPAAAVFLDRAGWPAEPRLGPSVSHGLAAHRSAAAAIDHAVCEMLERAAMTRAWHHQDFGLALPLDGLPDDSRQLALRCHWAGLQLRLMALVLPPALPVVMALLWTDHPPWFMVGAGAAVDLLEAATGALLEAACGWQALVQQPESEPTRRQLRQTESARGHHRYHAGPDASRRVVQTFIDGSRSSDRWPREQCRTSAPDALLDHAPGSLVVDLTPPDVAACGLSVQRVLAPRLPIYAFGRVGTPRAFQRAAGLPEPPVPHPFR